jgi:hypothetical protein
MFAPWDTYLLLLIDQTAIENLITQLNHSILYSNYALPEETL